MSTKKKSWTEKLADSKGLPKVEKIFQKFFSNRKIIDKALTLGKKRFFRFEAK
jgi:hypothetical protein